MFIRIFKAASIFLLMGCSLVQLNDSDGVLWVGVYTLPMVFFMVSKRISTALILGTACIYCLIALWFLPMEIKVIGDMSENLEIEQARESLGLLIIY